MSQTLSREAAPQLLHYRPWRGTLRPPAASVWPIARVALGMVIRRKLFWGLYTFGLFFFLFFFFGQNLLAYADMQSPTISQGGRALGPGSIVRMIRNALYLNGSPESYRAFFNYQGYIVMVVLALAGSIIVGNDLRFGSLPFYLSKPVSRWHYLLGKMLAVTVFVNLLTTLPALVLYAQYGLLVKWDYFSDQPYLAMGILAYGAVLSVSLSLILLATAMWLRKTVPLVMVWCTLLFFCRVVADKIVDELDFDKHWRLFDLWNNTYLVGSACLGAVIEPDAKQPPWDAAALVLVGVSLTCLTYLILRIRAVEVVR